MIKNDILFITTYWIGKGNNGGIIDFYYYDIKNDKILNTKEAFEKIGFSLEKSNASGEYKGIDGSYYKLTDEACDSLNSYSSMCGCGLKVKDNKLQFYYVDECL